MGVVHARVPPLRAASFVPSATEWVYALGLADRLVGVTSECGVSPDEKPWLVRPALDLPEEAASVDVAVRDAARSHRSLYRLDADALREARPDVILAQSLCDVCAAANHELEEAARILGYRPRVVALAPARLHDALADGAAVAEALGEPSRAPPLAHALRERLHGVARAVAGRPRPRVATLEWTDPPMRAGHWLPDVVTAAGGRETLGVAGAKSVRVAWDDVAAARPDVCVVAPCGVGAERAHAESRAVAARLPGVRVLAFDGARFFSRSGPSVVASVEALARSLHPDAFPSVGAR